jgi:hypothetical protein
MLLWQIYLYGAIIAAAGTSVAADLFSDDRSTPKVRVALTVVAGVLWPLMLIGLLQLGCLSIVAKVLHARSTTQPESRLPAGR